MSVIGLFLCVHIYKLHLGQVTEKRQWKCALSANINDITVRISRRAALARNTLAYICEIKNY